MLKLKAMLYILSQRSFQKELIDIKKSVWKKTQDKVFINDENQDNLKYDPEYDDQECELKDFKGQRVCSGYTYSDKNLNINAYVYGKTFVKIWKIRLFIFRRRILCEGY